MRNIYFLALVLSLVSQCAFAVNEYKKLPLLSLLLFQSREYADEKVEVYGYLAYGGKLYLTKSHAVNMNFPYSIDLLTANELEFDDLNQCVNQYVKVMGTIYISSEGMNTVKKIKKVWSDKQVCIEK